MDKTLSAQDDKQVSAAVRVFSILEALSHGGYIGVTELAGQTHLSKATAYRFLQTMKELGYVAQEGDSEKYGLTIKMFQLGSGALSNLDLIQLADTQMRELSVATSETIHLGVLDRDSFIYIHKIDSLYTLRMHSRIGARNSLHLTAIGKVLLAGMTQTQREQIMSRIQFEKLTDNSILSVDELRQRIEQVRQQGFGEDNEEQEAGVRCIAVPVYDRFGEVCAGLSISFPTLRQNADVQQRYISLLKNSAANLSASLGCHFK